MPFTLSFIVANTGQIPAKNLSVTFESTDFFPIQTLGAYNFPNLPPNSSMPISQPMLVNKDIGTKNIVSTTVKVSYNDELGKVFNESYTLTFPAINTTATATPTITPTVSLHPQLMILAYAIDSEMLHPGDVFTIDIQISNMGVVNAHDVNLVFGTSSETATTDSTPEADTTTIGKGDISNFAPVDSTNRKFLGDIPVGFATKIRQRMIVNISTDTGARPLDLTFSYTDDKGNTRNDTQTISLLIYSPMQIDVGFSGAVPTITVDESIPLSLQITNLGKKSVLLGNMQMQANNSEIETLGGVIGTLDSGSYFTADAKLTAHKAGKCVLKVKIYYLDDFGTARYLIRNVNLTIKEPPTPVPTPFGAGEEPTNQGFWDMLVSFLRGLFGIQSGAPQGQEPGVLNKEGLAPESLQSPAPITIDAYLASLRNEAVFKMLLFSTAAMMTCLCIDILTRKR